MNEPRVLHVTPPVKQHRFQHLGWMTQLSFDERDLFIRCTRGFIESSSSYHLHNLSPSIATERVSDPDALGRIRTAWLLLLAAVVIRFSDYNASIPLLAPVLALLWLGIFVVNLRHAWPYRWLVVREEFGSVVTRIRKAEEDAQAVAQQDLFIRNLTDAIERAKQREYYPDE
jgi:hypothetical protein